MNILRRLRRCRTPRFLLGLLLAYLFVFASLYEMEPKTTILRVGLFAGSSWGVPQGDSYAYIDEVIQNFEAAHPHVKVVYQSGIRKQDYSEWLSGRALAGELPDVFLLPPDDFDLYTNRGVLAPLDALAKDDPDLDLDDFYPAPLAYARSGGTGALYALPVECVPRLMFVNRTLLAREGIPLPPDDWTWDDFLAICREVTRDTDGDGRLDQFGAYGYTWQDAVVTSGQRLFRADGKASYFATRSSRAPSASRWRCSRRCRDRPYRNAISTWGASPSVRSTSPPTAPTSPTRGASRK